jgi:hypothetical protein
MIPYVNERNIKESTKYLTMIMLIRRRIKRERKTMTMMNTALSKTASEGTDWMGVVVGISYETVFIVITEDCNKTKQ